VLAETNPELRLAVEEEVDQNLIQNSIGMDVIPEENSAVEHVYVNSDDEFDSDTPLMRNPNPQVVPVLPVAYIDVEQLTDQSQPSSPESVSAPELIISQLDANLHDVSIRSSPPLAESPFPVTDAFSERDEEMQASVTESPGQPVLDSLPTSPIPNEFFPPFTQTRQAYQRVRPNDDYRFNVSPWESLHPSSSSEQSSPSPAMITCQVPTPTGLSSSESLPTSPIAVSSHAPTTPDVVPQWYEPISESSDSTTDSPYVDRLHEHSTDSRSEVDPAVKTEVSPCITDGMKLRSRTVYPRYPT
jgi:hypothetical protein